MATARATKELDDALAVIARGTLDRMLVVDVLRGLSDRELDDLVNALTRLSGDIFAARDQRRRRT